MIKFNYYVFVAGWNKAQKMKIKVGKSTKIFDFASNKLAM